MAKLEIELVPSSAFYSNVRSEVTKDEWDVIRKKCYDEASGKCEICGDNGLNQHHKHAVECHEIWDYDTKNAKQTLLGFIALCPRCHQSKHYGLAQVKGNEDTVRDHLKRVNGWSEGELNEHVNEKWKEWDDRSKISWELDIDYINKYINDSGVTILDKILSKVKKN